jgi:hypothetical protein
MTIMTDITSLDQPASMNRNDVIACIRAQLKRRSGKAWSVTAGRGTAWGWLNIDAPPARRLYRADGVTRCAPVELKRHHGHASLAERQEIATLMGFDQPIHFQGLSIPDSHAHYQEYCERAAGRVPAKIAQPYWD